MEKDSSRPSTVSQSFQTLCQPLSHTLDKINSHKLRGHRRNLTTLGSPKNSFDLDNIEVKPRILESKLSRNEKFLGLSDGFKKIFAKDEQDQKMVIPIAGYGGYRTGERSANMFGKTFRETSLESKRLQRKMMNQ